MSRKQMYGALQHVRVNKSLVRELERLFLTLLFFALCQVLEGDSFKMYPITGFGAVFIFGVSCYDLGHGK